MLEFLARVTAGVTRSPVGVVAGWLTQRHVPEWVSAKPKRFAWTLGLVMSGAMTIITNSGIRGWLPRTICLVCLALMSLESVLGLCLGCEIHGLLVRRGWVDKADALEICAHGACAVVPPSAHRAAVASLPAATMSGRATRDKITDTTATSA